VTTDTFTKGEHTRQTILENAIALFEERGFRETTLRDIAGAAHVSLGLVYRYYRSKEELAFALYVQLTDEVARKVKLPSGSVGERWAALLHCRFRVLALHRRTLVALAQVALDPESELGVLAPATEEVRKRWLAFHREVVGGAPGGEDLAQVLYGLDVVFVLYWIQDRSANARATRDAIDRFAKILDVAIALPVALPAITELAATFAALTKKAARER
jgi:AcrR family transcriptional regulator